MTAIEVVNASKSFILQPDRPRSFQELVVNGFRRGKRRKDEVLWALRDVSFSVKPGETLGLIGSNGSGKSTCLKLLTRILEPTTGAVRVQGRVSALLELGAGFHPDLTGRENVFLHGSVIGLGRREMARRYEDIVAFAELERFIDIPVKFYSSGMYVRLAFATAINVNPDVLLVDEVLAVGDQSFQEKCLARIHEMKALGVTIVFVSHSLDAVRSLCDRAIWLDHGEVREDNLSDVVIGRYLQAGREHDEAAAMAEREAERQSQPEPQAATEEETPTDDDPMARYRKRWGSREVEIVEVRFYDREGRDRLLLTTGEPMTIAIRYHAHQRIERPMFGLAIHRNDGLHLCGPNNVFAGFDIPYIEGEGEVRYTVDTLPLLEGGYYVTAAIHDAAGEHAYDHQSLYYPFKVQNGQVAERYGAIYMPARWEHQPADTPTSEALP